MKLSVRSLQFCLAIPGSLALPSLAALFLAQFFQPEQVPTLSPVVCLWLASWGGAWLYVAFAFPKLLRTHLGTTLAFLDLHRALVFIGILAPLARPDSKPGLAVFLAISSAFWLYFTGYLKRNALRLAAAETSSPQAAPWALLVWVLLMPALWPGVGAALAVAGLRTYMQRAKSQEAVHALPQLAAGIARCASESGALPASSEPVPIALYDIRGRSYRSLPGEWGGETFRCAKFKMTDPQYFAYQWQRVAANSGLAVAIADFDGDGIVEARFTQAVTCATPTQCSLGPVEERRTEFAGGQPAYADQVLLR